MNSEPTVTSLNAPAMTEAKLELAKDNVAHMTMASDIIDIIESYQQPLPAGVENLRPVGRSHFMEMVYHRLVKNEKISMVLPAFPFKSPNSRTKVLGILPDKAEEFALRCLDGLCKNIKRIYAPGAEVYIVSDGIVYSDLLGVPSRYVWSYGVSLRLFAEKELGSIRFVRISTLTDSPEPLTYEDYETQSSQIREKLMQLYFPTDYDVQKEKSSDSNVLATYQGYCKFLLLDLATSSQFNGLTRSAMKKKVSTIAEHMLMRGKAFAAAIQHKFPKHIRLSIHPSNGKDKLSVSLLGQRVRTMTPWHGSLLVTLDGSCMIRHRRELELNGNYEPVSKDGKPSHFREKSDLYDWENKAIIFDPMYPCGLRISVPESANVSFKSVDMNKLRKLAQLNSPVVLHGFHNTGDQQLFEDKAAEMGSIQSWIFGKILEVRDAGSETGGLNNVLSTEAMPMHFDGLFNTKVIVNNEDGQEKHISCYPKFQVFSSLIPAPQGTGRTLFASSRLLLKALLKRYTLPQLAAVTWDCKTDAFNATLLKDMALFVPHPENNTLCIRYHEPWPETHTKFDATEVRLHNDPDGLFNDLNSLLYDSRICNYLQFGHGDIIVSDNILMMHTREAYAPGSPRRFWRIHVN